MAVAVAPQLSNKRPFPGLRPYDVADSEFFFGREKQVSSLYRLLDLSHFISVVGSSGSGKSSLVFAGLNPLLLKERSQSGGRGWQIVKMHPGDSPLKELAGVLTRIAIDLEASNDPIADSIRADRIDLALSRSSFGLREALKEIPALRDKSVLLVVDQFEELFRYGMVGRSAQAAMKRQQAVSFVQLLLEAARSLAEPPIHVLITMRSDFIGDCARFQGLPEVVSSAQFLVPSLSRDQREDVIRLPIEKAGASIKTGLVERLLRDTGIESDQLPVLQHCLSRLWEARPADGSLTIALYEKVGELEGALSKHANQVMQGLPEKHVELVFRALSDRDREGRETRRAIPLGQLCEETGLPRAQCVSVVDRFRADDCSFLLPTTYSKPVLRNDDRIDVGHEALLRRWNKISDPEHGWLTNEERDGQKYRILLSMSEGS